jgi:hypothetical protein
MAVISGLLARLGFVRIGTYGLILTSEGRILSTRHAVLDDGLGGKIVGWNEGDLATMELERWHLGTAPAIAKRIAPPLMRPPAPPKPVQALVIAPVRAPSPVQVAHDGPADEDEWEWEIAVARARAAADPIPAEEIHEEIFETWEATPPPRQLVAPLQRAAYVPAMPPVAPGRTVIPVPPLSARPTHTRPMPVVEAVAERREPVRRFPRATSRHEETIRTHAAPPANDDLTSPSIALPPLPVASTAGTRARPAAPPNGGAVLSSARRASGKQC